ncbi:MAG: 1-acyl-sn-glycerol-3-phosphate acyltransferase [Candidatus Izemoplasmatales bacterium]
MKRPNPLLYATLGFLLRIYAFFKGQRIRRHAKIKGPAIVLSNHTSFYDFIYTTAAVYPKRVSYMAAGKMFYDPLLGFFLRMARAFPKCLFQADPVATMNVFRILRRKGIVSIFPEGQISPIGVTQPIAPSIAKLLKKAKVDVFAVRHQGAYLVNPPWSKKNFPGRIQTDVELVLTKERLASLTEEEVLAAVVEALRFNVSSFDPEGRYRYRINDIENLESVLYRCPRCGGETLHADGRDLVCPACGNRLSYDPHGKVGGLRIDDLYHVQEAEMRMRIESDPAFRLEADVRLESFRDERLVEVGRGRLSLTHDGYRYEGTVDGRETVLAFDPKNVPTLPSDLGRNVQIYEGYLIYQFAMDVPTIPTKFVIAAEILHARSLSGAADAA